MQAALRIGLFLIAFTVATRAVSAVTTTAGSTAGAIRVDGDLSDSGWAAASRVDRFFEFARGDDGAPPVATTALVTYDAHALYVAFDVRDPAPGDIRAAYSERDGVKDDQDWVEVVLDARGDRQSAAFFRVNPRGIVADGIRSDADGGEDFAPDFYFAAAARVNASGWTAELRIPLTSLHYGTDPVQSWGVLFIRNYPRAFRYAMASAPIPKASPCFVCNAGSLDGLRGLPHTAHLDVAPYVTGSLSDRRQIEGGGFQRERKSDGGADLKWAAGSATTIDATLRPDFSQVEADAAQVTVDKRFAIDFPEKRPFFLEGIDLFRTPLRVISTRSITQPMWGLRATRQSATTSWIVLAANDEGGGSVILPGPSSSDSAPQDYRSRVFVGRARRSIGSSYAGFVATAREIVGGGHNRVAGPDVLLRPDEKTSITAQALLSDTRDPDRRDLSPLFAGAHRRGIALSTDLVRTTAEWTIYSGAKEISSGFRADDGFVPQAGMRTVYFEADRKYYPRGFKEMRWWIGAQPVWSTDRHRLIRLETYPGLSFDGPLSSIAYLTLHPVEEEEVLGKLRRRSFASWQFALNPWKSLPVVSVQGETGGKFDYVSGRRGRGGAVTAEVSSRGGEHVAADLSATRDWLDAGASRFYTAAVWRLVATYTPTARASLRVIGQSSVVRRTGETRSGEGSLSAVVIYRLDWQTSVYVGYGHSSVFDAGDRRVPNGRSLFMKMSYAIHR